MRKRLKPGAEVRVIDGPFRGHRVRIISWGKVVRAELQIYDLVHVVRLRRRELVRRPKPCRVPFVDAPYQGPEACQPRARDSELERAIAEDIEATEPYLVYGDWLLEQEDPRGVLIALQAAHKPQEALINEQRGYFVGTYRWDPSTKWHLGYLKSTKVCIETSLEPLRCMLELPSARFLQELTVYFAENGAYFDDDVLWVDEAKQEQVKELFTKTPMLIRRLALIDCENDYHNLALHDVSWAFSQLIELRSLTLRGRTLEIKPRNRTSGLECLTIVTPSLTKKNVQALAEMQWPELRRLELNVGAEWAGADVDAIDLFQLLDEKRFPQLRELGLRNVQFGDDLCGHLLALRVLPQLESLDLSGSVLTDEGAETLAWNAKRFKHLRVIDVSKCYLTKAGIGRLRQLKPLVLSHNQREPGWDEFFEEGVEVAGEEGPEYMNVEIVS